MVACSATPDADGIDEGASSDGTLSYVGQHVSDVLARDHAAEEGKSWSVSRGNRLSDAFLLQVPLASSWGQTSLPAATRCKADDARCDPDFLLPTCSRGADCGDQGRCVALKATVAHRSQAPRSLCVGHSDTMLDDVWSAIATAKESVDLSSLTPADGRFEAAIRNAITFASESVTPPRIRMLFGDYPTSFVSAKATLDRLVRDVAPSSTIDVAIGTYRSGLDSWNHSKIIVRDQSYAIVGGTNLWDEHYLSKNPVHDLWLTVDGRAARDGSRFLDQLWTEACGKGNPINQREVASRIPIQQGRCPAPLTRPTDAGSGEVPIISAGRLGAIGANPSDRALVALVESARTSIRLSQQDVGPVKRVGVSFASWPEELMTALVGAMARGVGVSFILSNPDSVPGNVGAISAYLNTYDNGWSLADVGKKFVGVAAAHPEVMQGKDPAAVVCEKLKLMNLRMNAQTDAWADGSTYANHAKLMVVDDRAFYLGSQNTYVANLAEFGYVVDDQRATQKLLDAYLTPAERFSSRTAVSGPGVACSFGK